MQAELQKLMRETQKMSQDTKLATPQMFFQGAIAMAAMIGAGVALAKVIYCSSHDEHCREGCRLRKTDGVRMIQVD